jgi:hypothetical protein
MYVGSICSSMMIRLVLSEISSVLSILRNTIFL